MTWAFGVGSEFVQEARYDGLGVARWSWGDASGAVETTVPDAGSTQTEDAAGYLKRIATDSHGNVIAVEEGKLAQGALVRTGTYDYDGNGRLLSFQDANGNRHLYSYDAAGRLQEVLRQGDGAPSAVPYVSYDYQGPWVIEMREGSSSAPWKVQWDYDAIGRTTEKRIKQENLATGYATYTWDWDGSGPTQWIGVRHKTTDPAGETRYFYDETAPWGDLGRLTTLERDDDQTATDLVFEYDYDFEGNTIQTTWPSGVEVHTTYTDGWKKQDTLYLPNPAAQGTVAVDYAYDDMWGTLNQWTAETGATDWKMTFTRPTPNRLSQVGLTHGVPLNVQGYYGYYANGWLHTKEITPMMSTGDHLVYEYDTLGRATTVRDTPTGDAYEQYSYDDAGNLTSFTQGLPGSQQAWTYAAPAQFGEIGSRTDGTVTDTHTWHGTTGRMTSWDTNTGSSLVERDFEYDSAGRLVELFWKEGAATRTTKLYYDVDDQLVREERGNDTYLRFQGHRQGGPKDEQIEPVLPQIRVVTDDQGDQHVRFAYIDVDGQAVHVYGITGSIVSREVTGIYGVPLVGAPADYTVTPWGWEVDGLHGQEEDRENEVMHFGARHTVFRDGMWMQPEPMLSINAAKLTTSPRAAGSGYSEANPLVLADITGFMPGPHDRIATPAELGDALREAEVQDFDQMEDYFQAGHPKSQTGGDMTVAAMNVRYVETPGGIVDMKHVANSANTALVANPNVGLFDTEHLAATAPAASAVANLAHVAAAAVGYAKEMKDFISSSPSAFSPEDVPSNNVGRDIASATSKGAAAGQDFVDTTVEVLEANERESLPRSDVQNE